MIRRLKVSIQGTVQGIGFRPFIYNLAHKKNLYGYVANTSAGVDIEIQGESNQIELFLQTIKSNPLPLAHIEEVQTTALRLRDEQRFVIGESESQKIKMISIPPDISICENCLKELQDPQDRRYRYPFINCTSCGPRYTIIEDMPYDRPYTSMRDFQMCDDCLKEYSDPANRRFHAQPNACPACGPSVRLVDRDQRPLEAGDPVNLAIELLKKGYIVAIKGLGGFHLAVDAENSKAVKNLRERKHREEKPLALMAYDVDRIREFAHVSPEEEALLRSPARPIVILKKKEPNSISPDISPSVDSFGVMLPYTPLHYLLLSGDLPALVMTSGNRSKDPISINNTDAFRLLGAIADFYLNHNRDIYLRVDDSIARKIGGRTRMIRRSRGYAPTPIFLQKEFPQILACGAESANTVCLSKGKLAIISQYIGDLTNFEVLKFFQQTIEHLKGLFNIEPVFIAHDLHPDYLSTQYALKETHGKKIAVQHHHAHIVSCMTEHGLEGAVIGLAFDGTGYGLDGRIWGGEILLSQLDQFNRLAHFDYVPLPGGNAAIEEPWRMAVTYLYHTFGESFWDLKVPLFEKIEKRKIQFIVDMIIRKVNSPETSSLGRLFDGIAAILDIRYEVSYEGQAAVELEMTAAKSGQTVYPYEYVKEKKAYQIHVYPMIRAVVEDMDRGICVSDISRRFHSTLIHLFADLCGKLRDDTGCNRIVLSGGVFQNVILLSGLESVLKEVGFEVFTHSKIPTNDGGISFGQAAVAAALYHKSGV